MEDFGTRDRQKLTQYRKPLPRSEPPDYTGLVYLLVMLALSLGGLLYLGLFGG